MKPINFPISGKLWISVHFFVVVEYDQKQPKMATNWVEIKKKENKI